ncbi:MAG: ZIP family metal transporter [Clostridia bacterium]|nr:ZIP family metal transporter [Clostridia bacterium]
MRSFLFAAVGTLFTFGMTALGAALVFFFRRRISPRVDRLCFGLAGGVMSAAAVFSLLLPAVEQVQAADGAPWVTASLGFALGAGLMMALDGVLAARRTEADGAWRTRAMLLSAVTLHNIPEGMAVGLAFAAAAGKGGAAPAAACALALGIGIQNIPEGAAVALPLRQAGFSRRRSFAFGAASGVVEPVFGMLAALSMSLGSGMMPGLMAFSAGAMMWVVFSEMLPRSGEKRDGALAAAAGYLLMMALDLALG